MGTGFYWDERCFWHSGGNYAFMAPVGGLVQPIASGGLPENPETKRRLVNLLRVTGLWGELETLSAEPAERDALLRVHSASYLDDFEAMAARGGGELGLRTPFGPDGFKTACLSAGLAQAALLAVLRGSHQTAYALCRPPGHHCLPDRPNGFCLLNNIAIAVQTARSEKLASRIAILDWDVHHGNGTEAIFYEDPDVLTVSLHQERNYPRDTGDLADRGRGAGLGGNVNIPLPPGAGHNTYMAAIAQTALPQIGQFRPDVIVVACGFDASGVDPLGRMLAGSDTFRAMTRQVLDLADGLCGGRVVMVHEGGYSELHVPFCAHAVLEELSASSIRAADPLAARISAQQPGPAFDAFAQGLIDDIAAALR
ncbi:MAG: class II histone deacetylase [Pseudomonadota bacterium]